MGNSHSVSPKPTVFNTQLWTKPLAHVTPYILTMSGVTSVDKSKILGGLGQLEDEKNIDVLGIIPGISMHREKIYVYALKERD